MKRAVIYARFSSDMQREESIEAQIRAGRNLCDRKGYALTNIYIDEAKSGTSITGRDNYNRMMADAMEHKFDVAIFHKVDRNARNEFDYYTFKRSFETLGISYEYSGQSVDDSPEGQMMESMLVGMAAYYSRNLAKETKKGLNENAYKAMFNGGTPPFGYRIENGKYIIDEREAEGVRMVFSMYANGYGYTQIARALAAVGFVSKKGNPFAKNSLFDMLGNEKYIGTYTFNKVVKGRNKKRNTHGSPSDELIRIENAIPAIIDKNIFARVQEKRTFNKHRGGAFRTTVNYLLSGRIFCGECGSSMSGTHLKVRGQDYWYYTCAKKERVATCKCTNRAVRKYLLEKWVLSQLLDELLSPEGIERIAEEMSKAYAEVADQSHNKLEALTKAQKQAEQKLNNLYVLIEEGIADEYDKARLKQTKLELTDIKEKLAELQKIAIRPVLNTSQITSTIQALRESILTKNDEDAKKNLIQFFVKRVIVGAENISLELADDMLSVLMVPRTGIEPVRVSLPEGF